MQIAVVGSGYVGLVAGACFADLGHDVIVVDNDQKKLSALNRGEVPIHEKFLPELLHRHRGARLKFSDDLESAVRASAAIFVAVGTPPTDHGEADLSYVESVARSISGAINNYKVVVEKSTVPVYTSDWVRKIILRNGAEAEAQPSAKPGLPPPCSSGRWSASSGRLSGLPVRCSSPTRWSAWPSSSSWSPS